MKVSKQTQGQLDRLAKTGAFSTNSEILTEVKELFEALDEDNKLDVNCGTCVKNAMYGILKAQKETPPKAAAPAEGKKAATPPAKTADKIVPLNGTKQFTDEELAEMNVPKLKSVAKSLNEAGAAIEYGTKAKKAELIEKIKAAYAAKTADEDPGAKSGNAEDEDEETVEITVTQEILNDNPDLVEQGVKVGDVIDVPADSVEDEEE